LPHFTKAPLFYCLCSDQNLSFGLVWSYHQIGKTDGSITTHALNRMNAAEVKNAEHGKHSDGKGLWLVKRGTGGAHWVMRVTVHWRRWEMGLGSYPDLSWKDARASATRWRTLADQEVDPVKRREKDHREAIRNLHFLNDIAADAFERRKAELKDDGEAGRRRSPPKLHVLSKQGKVPVAGIDRTDIRDTFAPIWHSKADTATKALNRFRKCLKHGAALGLDVDLQATEKAKALLGKQRHKMTNVASIPWQEVPACHGSL